LVGTLIVVAKYLKWREFIIAFFIMAFAASLPNLFVDINAAMNGMPEVAFGDIVGGNLLDLTLVIAIAVLFSAKALPAESEMIQKSAVFTSVIAVLPILLIWDSQLGRGDGVILLMAFALYTWWLFAKEDRFKKVYRGRPSKTPKSWASLILDFVKMMVFVGLLLVASHFIVGSAQAFSEKLNIPLSLVGILIIGAGNVFPETYFAIISAKRGEGWLVLGDIMGSVIVCATLVLGIVALLFPFKINDLSPFLITRIFTIIAALIFILFVKTGKKITKNEGLLFMILYVVFIAVQTISN
jgi:cation:H+ antiporter